MARQGALRTRARWVPKPLRDYFHETRSLGYSFLAVLPLLVIYAFLTLALGDRPGSVLRYGVKAMLGHQASLVHQLGVVALSLVAIAIFFWVGRSALRRARKRWQSVYFPLMVAEAGALAILLGLGLNAVPRMAVFVAEGVADSAYEVMMAVGAGLFEELVFRLILLGSLVFFFTRLRKFPVWAAYLFALGITSTAFAVAHYLHVHKGSFDGHVFVLRQLAGVFFGIVYCLRGFGIAVYTHTWYDLFVTFS